MDIRNSCERNNSIVGYRVDLYNFMWFSNESRWDHKAPESADKNTVLSRLSGFFYTQKVMRISSILIQSSEIHALKYAFSQNTYR